MAKLRYAEKHETETTTKDSDLGDTPSARTLRYRVESWKSQVRLRRREKE